MCVLVFNVSDAQKLQIKLLLLLTGTFPSLNTVNYCAAGTRSGGGGGGLIRAGGGAAVSRRFKRVIKTSRHSLSLQQLKQNRVDVSCRSRSVLL